MPEQDDHFKEQSVVIREEKQFWNEEAVKMICQLQGSGDEVQTYPDKDTEMATSQEESKKLRNESLEEELMEQEHVLQGNECHVELDKSRGNQAHHKPEEDEFQRSLYHDEPGDKEEFIGNLSYEGPEEEFQDDDCHNDTEDSQDLCYENSEEFEDLSYEDSDESQEDLSDEDPEEEVEEFKANICPKAFDKNEQEEPSVKETSPKDTSKSGSKKKFHMSTNTKRFDTKAPRNTERDRMLKLEESEDEVLSENEMQPELQSDGKSLDESLQFEKKYDIPLSNEEEEMSESDHEDLEEQNTSLKGSNGGSTDESRQFEKEYDVALLSEEMQQEEFGNPEEHVTVQSPKKRIARDGEQFEKAVILKREHPNRKCLEEEDELETTSNNTSPGMEVSGPVIQEQQIPKTVTRQKKRATKSSEKIRKESIKAKCNYCREYYHPRYLKWHIRKIHLKIAPYKCDKCSVTCSTQSLMKAHSVTHLKVKPFSCDQCSRTFSRAHHLVEHKKSHTVVKQTKCDICSKSFTHPCRLKAHKIKDHSDMKTQYPCKVCEKDFPNKANLKRHLTTVHLALKLFSCDMCKKSFTNKHNLENHIASIHQEKQDHNCDVCDKMYSSQANLWRHKRDAHSGQQFACKKCNVSFTSQSALKHHTTSEAHHLFEQLYQCPMCIQAFIRKDQLTEHVSRQHSRKKVFLPLIMPFTHK